MEEQQMQGKETIRKGRASRGEEWARYPDIALEIELWRASSHFVELIVSPPEAMKITKRS